MSRGRNLAELISDLRDELRRANNSAASPDDIASLRRTINHVMKTLWLGHNWPHLNTDFEPIPLVAGQRYYDYPAGLDPERVGSVYVSWSGNYLQVERGITKQAYNMYDSRKDERSSPALRWDIRFTGVKEQMEIWPIPDGSEQSLHMSGTYQCRDLVNDADVCILDSEIVVLFAALELLPTDAPDREAKSSAAAERLRLLKSRATSGGDAVWTNGAGDQNQGRSLQVSQVRVR